MIELDGVSKSYDPGRGPAVQGVTLSIPRHAFVALVGDSGSGKTTLLKTINRLIEPDTGSICIEGRDARRLPPHELRRKIGYVFQGIGLFPHMSVAENIGITPRLLEWPEPDASARIVELMDLMSLPRDFSERRPAQLSGGQQQRVGVARALAAKPSIMLMDEPFGALDPLTRDSLGGEYRRLHEQMGLTTVMVTHDVLEAILLADRIVMLRAGQIVADDVPHALLNAHPDPGVREMMSVPLRQAARVQAVLEEEHRVDDRIAAALAVLPDYLGSHVLLSAAALALGIAISLPLVVFASRFPKVRWPLLAFSSLIQTVPSLALLALFYPLLLALSSVTEQLFGRRVSALGFLPSLLALTLYSMLPIVRNGVTALMNLDASVMEAARGVGMTGRQMLLRIELPLAAPVLMAGVRTAAVWVIGTATLATPVGQTSLGNYIFSGLQVQNWVFVSFGCLAAAALALLTDFLLARIESGVAMRKPRRIVIAVALLLAGIGAALASRHTAEPTSYVIGAKNFSEQYILAALMEDRLEEQAATVNRRIGLGSTIAFQAVANGDIDAYVDYSGTLWANVMRRQDKLPRQAMLTDMSAWLRKEHGVEMLGALGFENAYALAMRRDRAEALGVRTIADLAQHAPTLSIGGDLEFFARPEWGSLRQAYGLQFRERRQFQPTFMYQAVASREVDVISAFSSDGRIAAYDLLVLGDPQGAALPYDAVILVAPNRIEDPVLHRALRPLVGAIPIELMREANQMVDRDSQKRSPEQAAKWLAGRISSLDVSGTGDDG